MRLLLTLSVLALTTALTAKDLATHPIFKRYIGSWKAAGDLKGEENKTITVTEEWTGKAEGENTFVIEGTRTMNGDTQPFKWTITYNEGADTFEAVLTGPDPASALRFEAHASEVTMTMEMKALTSSGGTITITESFADVPEGAFDSKVIFTNESGQTTLEGTLKNERQTAP